MDIPICYKCHTEKAKYKTRLQLVCEKCFITNIEHTFRCTIKNCIFPKNGESLLICISGGANSKCLLHLVDTCNNPLKTTKMMKFLPTILYIDDGSFYNIDPNQTEAYLEEIQAKYSMPIIRKSLEELVPDLHSRLPSNPQPRADMIYLEIHNQIVNIAKENGFSKVVTGESASRISAQVLSGICKGSGVSVERYANSCIESDGIKIGRPMRELLDKEVCIYLYLQKLSVLTKLPPSINPYPKPTIDVLVQNFLQNLQSKFPSTVHTLLRTASKLIPRPLDSICSICKGPKDQPLCPLENFVNKDEALCYSCHHLINP